MLTNAKNMLNVYLDPVSERGWNLFIYTVNIRSTASCTIVTDTKERRQHRQYIFLYVAKCPSEVGWGKSDAKLDQASMQCPLNETHTHKTLATQ